MPDDNLSLAAYGLLCRLLNRDEPTFTMADVQALEFGGMGRAKATRLIDELRFIGYVRRTRGGFVMDGVAAEQWEYDEPEVTPAPKSTAAYTAAICA